MITIRHERFLQAGPQSCFQLFLDEGVICCTRAKKMASERISLRAQNIGNNNIKSYLVSKFFLRYSTVTGQENAQGQNEHQANHFRFRFSELKAKKTNKLVRLLSTFCPSLKSIIYRFMYFPQQHKNTRWDTAYIL